MALPGGRICDSYQGECGTNEWTGTNEEGGREGGREGTNCQWLGIARGRQAWVHASYQGLDRDTACTAACSPCLQEVVVQRAVQRLEEGYPQDASGSRVHQVLLGEAAHKARQRRGADLAQPGRGAQGGMLASQHHTPAARRGHASKGPKGVTAVCQLIATALGR